MEIQTAESLFHEYKVRTERNVRVYNNLKTFHPYESFPKLARHIWQMGILAEMWGTIASRLSGNKRNYLADWREGK